MKELFLSGDSGRHNEESCRKKINDIIEEYQRGALELPPWQRENAWTEIDKKEYIKSLFDLAFKGRNAITSITTCRIKERDNSKIEYLNDGAQRISTCIESLKNADKYSTDKEDLLSVFKKVSVPYEHRNYDTFSEAAEEFQNINKGTRIADHDYHKIPMVILKDYEKIKPTMENYYEFFKSLCKELTGLPEIIKKYPMRNKIEREALCFYWFHFICKDKERFGYPESKAFLPKSGKKAIKSNSLEQQLANYWQDMSLHDIKDSFEEFKKFFRREFVFIKDRWGKYITDKTNQDTVMKYNCLKFLLNIALWTNKNNISIELLKAFLDSFFKTVRGQGRYYYIKNDHQDSIVLRAQNKKIQILCENNLIDKRIFGEITRERIIVKKGMHASHNVPFSKQPEDQLLIEEPALLNMARGKK